MPDLSGGHNSPIMIFSVSVYKEVSNSPATSSPMLKASVFVQKVPSPAESLWHERLKKSTSTWRPLGDVWKTGIEQTVLDGEL